MTQTKLYTNVSWSHCC